MQFFGVSVCFELIYAAMRRYEFTLTHFFKAFKIRFCFLAKNIILHKKQNKITPQKNSASNIVITCKKDEKQTKAKYFYRGHMILLKIYKQYNVSNMTFIK